MLTAEEEAEIADLASRLGDPLRWKREYAATTTRNREWARKTTRRRAEVILILPRGGERVLLHTKPTYPSGVYRLPGGGINRNEPVELAALREAQEETGFQVSPTRFLGVIENTFSVDGERLTYPSFVLLMHSTSKQPRVMDPDEPISGFAEVQMGELRGIARQLDSLPPDWQPWGHFRAAPHALAAEALQK